MSANLNNLYEMKCAKYNFFSIMLYLCHSESM